MQIRVERIVVTLDNLPPAFEGFTIAHISDLHGTRLTAQGFVARSIRSAKADALAITGDFVSHRVNEVGSFLPFLRDICLSIPVFAVSGNHDHDVGWDTVASRLADAGVIVLNNEHFALQRGAALLYIVGVQDPFSGRGDLARAMPKDEQAFVLLLAHSPSYFEAYAKSGHFLSEQESLKRIALALCGHTHGGQVKLPLIGAVTNGSRRPFPRDYVEGLSKEGKCYLYISRGLGWGIIPLRFLSHPEVTIITLRSTAA